MSRSLKQSSFMRPAITQQSKVPIRFFRSWLFDWMLCRFFRFSQEHFVKLSMYLSLFFKFIYKISFQVPKLLAFAFSQMNRPSISLIDFLNCSITAVFSSMVFSWLTITLQYYSCFFPSSSFSYLSPSFYSPSKLLILYFYSSKVYNCFTFSSLYWQFLWMSQRSFVNLLISDSISSNFYLVKVSYTSLCLQIYSQSSFRQSSFMASIFLYLAAFFLKFSSYLAISTLSLV